jgi:hypothetical protein
MIADLFILIGVLASSSTLVFSRQILILLVFLVLADMVLWVIIYRLTCKWLDYLYFDKGLEIGFERMVSEAFGLYIPGLILLITQFCTDSFRNYLRSKNKS